jgi:DNA repair photolyase
MQYINAKQILSGFNTNDFWFGINYNMNIYKGCSHGCIYCDSRSDCYGIDNFDEIRIKKEALNIIQRELSSKRTKGVVGTGAMSDPYNPIEAEVKLTRGALNLINKYGFGISIATKSSLVVRDTDILLEISKHSPVLVLMTITTVDDNVSRVIEPNVNLSSERFASLKYISNHGIKTGILLMPTLPFITDSERNIDEIVDRASKSGVSYIYPSFGVTLRQNQRTHFLNKLEDIDSGLKKKYIDTFGNSYMCNTQNDRLPNRFRQKCEEVGIKYKMAEIISDYKIDYQKKQLSIFGSDLLE